MSKLATLTIFSDSGDGFALNDDTVWATNRAAATADSIDNTGSAPYIEASLSGGNYRIIRGFLAFDTSALIDKDLLSVVNVYVSWFTGTWVDAGVNAYKALVEWSEGVTTITTASFNDVGSTLLAPTVDDSATGYQAFVMNSTGRALINRAGLTPLAMRIGFDFDNVAPTGANTVQWRASENSGTSADPYMEVQYYPYKMNDMISSDGIIAGRRT